MAENLKNSIREAAKRLEQNDVKGALEALEPLMHPTTEPTTRIEALRIATLAKLLGGDRKGARETIDEAVQSSEPLGSAVRARVFERRALVLQDAGELAAARADLATAATHFGRAGDAPSRAQVEDRSGTLAAAAGDLEEALLSHLTAAGLRRGTLEASANRLAGPVTAIPKDFVAATEPSKDALGEALALVQAGGAAHLGGAKALARTALERAAALLERLPQAIPLRAQALHNLGVVLSDLGEHWAGLEQLEQALKLDEKRNAPRDAAATRLRIALVARRRSDYSRAKAEAQKAKEAALAQNDANLLVEALLELSSASMAANEGEAALAAAKEAIDAAGESPKPLARATLHAATCAKMLGKREPARAGFAKAKELAETAGDPVLAAAAARELEGLGPAS